tara:strand:+ start:99 stop:365 length:267 start_codon:yes stop_codon:yes gene_type:complete
MSYDPKLGIENTYYIMIMQITGSSAIANVNFKDASLVGITFTSQDTEYDFKALDSNLVRNGLSNAIAKGDSVGKLIASYRREGQLTEV